MSFGGFLENKQGGGGARMVAEIPYSNGSSNHHHHHHHMEAATAATIMASGAISHPHLAKSMFNNSPALSLALQQTNMDGQGDVMNNNNRLLVGDNNNNNNNNTTNNNNYEGNMMSNNNGLRRSREEEHESRSGSDNMDGASGDDDLDAADINNNKPRKKRYHRHTPQQIQELEALFKECPHPDEKQRLELSKRLCLETRQVKFWFQNRRTQMKTQLERHENTLLRQENDKLRAENMSLREAMRNPICTNCGGPTMIGEISLEEQHLRIENARLKDELDRVCALAGKFLGRPIPSIAPHPPLPNSSLELGVGNNNNSSNGGFVVGSTMPLGPDFVGMGISSNTLGVLSPTPPSRGIATTNGMNSSNTSSGYERSMVLELALGAMDELVKMAQSGEPLWIRGMEMGGREVLNHEEYSRTVTPCIGLRPNGFVSEASRETAIVIINSLPLVDTLMDSNRWSEMFPCMVARTSTTEVISSGINGTRNGALQLMQAELQVLSPLVPVREVNFLRFCKQHAEGVWAVVDVSIDTIREPSSAAPTFVSCRRLPSGCVIQDMPNGYSKVTWVEHAEYDESQIHELYRPLVSSGMGFGAQRWIATLQRQCECLAILMSSAVSPPEHSAITSSGRRSMLKLAQRMTNNFCAGVCASTVHKWNKLNAGNFGEDVRVMTRKSLDDPGEPPGIVLSAATSVWLPVSPQRLFDFLRDERLRSEWDILSNGGPMQEMAHIAKGQDHGNCVSLLRASAMNSNQSSMLILQETCTDASGSLVVYAPVDIPAMHLVMNGGDSAYVALLPSGFAVAPDGSSGRNDHNTVSQPGGGSLLTVAFQILVNSLPTAKLTVESVETVNNLISCTVQKIKAALQSEG
ncbi:homeobox-leucine zipper protein ANTHOCYANINLESS 2 isoform X1 [Arachis ipaensis]|uniref:homeobox-leucine zipper protein ANTHOCYANINLESS 2 isoform X1 n=1 Tax=Arachis ipaensis TaxID=130454 RepID=UPI0007AFCC46|nr:homeobox-leucine zipper protein ANTHOCYANINLESS 2 isoform X1 [Arachis ipaensis]